MENKAAYIVELFRGCKQPSKQIRIITELTGCEIAEVIRILQTANLIPQRVTVKNYQKLLAEEQHRPVSEEMRHYIVGSVMVRTDVLAKKVGLPIETVQSIRDDAMRKARRSRRSVHDSYTIKPKTNRNE